MPSGVYKRTKKIGGWKIKDTTILGDIINKNINICKSGVKLS